MLHYLTQGQVMVQPKGRDQLPELGRCKINHIPQLNGSVQWLIEPFLSRNWIEIREQ